MLRWRSLGASDDAMAAGAQDGWQVLAFDRTTPGEFNRPYGVAVDGQGNLCVADAFNRRIQKLSAD